MSSASGPSRVTRTAVGCLAGEEFGSVRASTACEAGRAGLMNKCGQSVHIVERGPLLGPRALLSSTGHWVVPTATAKRPPPSRDRECGAGFAINAAPFLAACGGRRLYRRSSIGCRENVPDGRRCRAWTSWWIAGFGPLAMFLSRPVRESVAPAVGRRDAELVSSRRARVDGVGN